MSAAVYRQRRRRWRRWAAFALTVIGLTLLVMIVGVFLAIIATDSGLPGSDPLPTEKSVDSDIKAT